MPYYSEYNMDLTQWELLHIDNLPDGRQTMSSINFTEDQIPKHATIVKLVNWLNSNAKTKHE